MTSVAFSRGPMIALMTSTAFCGVLAAGWSRAGGIPVMDGVLTALVGEQHAETVARWITQGAQMANQIKQTASLIGQGTQIINQGVALYDNFTHPSRIWQEAKNLTMGYVMAPLPSDGNELRRAISGQIGFDLPVSFSLSGLFNGFLNDNLRYRPEGDDPNAVRLRQEASSNATRQSLAQQGYDSNARRIEGINELRQRLATANTASEKMDLQARLTAELGVAQAQTNQILTAQMWAQADDARQRQQQEQASRKSADDMVRWADTVIASRGRSGVPTATPISARGGDALTELTR